MKPSRLQALAITGMLASLPLDAARAEGGCAIGVSAHSLDPSQATRYRTAGFRVVRLDLAYSAVIHREDEHWAAHDGAVAALLRAGVTPLLILHYDMNGAAGFATDEDVARFAAFARSASARYPLALFEILNEPNLTAAETGIAHWVHVEPERYAQVVREVRAHVGPRVRLLGPGIGGGSCHGLDWLGRVAHAGGLDELDAVSVHPYCVGSPDGLPAYLRRARGIAGAVPLVITEWGFDAADEIAQAALVSDAIEAAIAADLDMLVLYRWDAADRGFGLHRDDGTAKPALGVVSH